MHLYMIAVNFFSLSQFYDTLFELANLYRAGGWGICAPIIWLSIKICCRMVEYVTFPPEIYAFKSFCIHFLVKFTTFCFNYHFLLGFVFEFLTKVADFEENFFELRNIPTPFF